MSKDLSQINLIIPAAGFGTRVGRPESKEMLINPKTGKILIDRALQAAKGLNARALVISREEKKNLNAEILLRKSKGDQVELLCVPPTKEWPESILKSQSLWKNKNIVVLPDTWWEPSSILHDMEKNLDHCEVNYALFQTAGELSYGFISAQNDKLQICEKPQENLGIEFKAWGIFGFRKSHGEALLKAHLESTFDHQIKTLALCAGIHTLNEFTDLTRASF